MVWPELDFAINTVYPIGGLMMSIVAQLLSDVKDDDQAGRDAYGQTKDVDGCVEAMLL